MSRRARGRRSASLRMRDAGRDRGGHEYPRLFPPRGLAPRDRTRRTKIKKVRPLSFPGTILAHEIGHTLGLGHRAHREYFFSRNKDHDFDGLDLPDDRNLMDTDVVMAKQTQDLDLIQAIAVRGSRVFAP